MIDFLQVKKQFGTQTVLAGASFRIHPGERVGVVGPNGSGKSTVFSLIAGEIKPDEGDIVVAKNLRMGHLHQQLRAHAVEESLIDFACKVAGDLPAIEREIHEVERALVTAQGRRQAELLRRLGDLQHAFEHGGGYDLRSRAEAGLSGLGFRAEEFARPFRSFSGGWQMRAELVRTLVARPDLLLLDEPSNYLDLPAIDWLQRFLRGFEGTLLLISHDRYLLEQLTNQTLEIRGGCAVKTPGGYARYVREREERHAQQVAAHRQYRERKAHLEAFIHRFRAQATKAAQVQSRIKMLAKLEPVAAPAGPVDLSRLRIPDPPRCGAHVMTVRNLGFSYDGTRWILRGVDLDVEGGQKIALVGYNGMGKTTLLRLLAGALAPMEGERREGHKVVLGYQSQDFAETMPPGKTLLRIVHDANPDVNERGVRSLLGSFGFAADAVNKTSGVLSGGEKIRLAFARIFVRPPNLLLLDEPTTNLDIHGREALERALRAYAGAVCLVSHDVAFVRGVAGHIWAIESGSVTRHVGSYDDYLERTGRIESAKSLALRPASDGGNVGRGSEQRRQRAQAREAARGLREMEEEMGKLHEEQQVLCARLSGGEEGMDAASISARLAALTRRLTAVEARWLDEADRLEQAHQGE